MNENTYQPMPFEQRPSQRLGAWDYVRKVLPIALLPFATGGAGWLIGRQIKPDMSRPAMQDLENKSLLGALISGNRYRAQNDGHYGTVLLGRGMVAGTVISGYLAWRRSEKKRLEVADVVASVKDIAPLHRTDEDLKKDNALVRKMIAYEQQKQEQLAEGGYRERLQAQTGESAILR